MPRILFLPDTPLDEEGNRFQELICALGLDEADYAVGGDAAGAEFVAFIGKEEASRRFGERVKTGRQQERLDGAEVYVLPSTAKRMRGSFFQGVWQEFAARVLDRDLAVRDEYKGMAPGEIKAALDKKRHPFGVLAANVVYDFNIGTLIRNANAFLAREVLVYGRRRIDRRGAMGSYVYESIVHVADRGALGSHVLENDYSVVVFEETKSSISLPEFAWPHNPLMVFGQEGPGVPEELLDCADATVHIPLFGSMRSINVGVASGIAMYDWHRKRLEAR